MFKMDITKSKSNTFSQDMTAQVHYNQSFACHLNFDENQATFR